MAELSEYMKSCSSTTKNFLFTMPQGLWPPNLAGGLLTVRGSYQQSIMILWSRGFARSRGKLKPLYLNYHNDFYHPFVGDLPWKTPAREVTSAFNHAVLWDQVKNLNHFKKNPKTSLGRDLSWGLPPIKSHGSFSVWSCDDKLTNDKLKPFFLDEHRIIDHET